jgi:hypothetical protein
MVNLLGPAMNMTNAMPCKPHVAAQGHCLALAEVMVMWRWESVLLNDFLNWSLKMQWAM